MNQLGLIPMGGTIFGAIGAFEMSLQFGDSCSTMTIVAAGFDMEVAAIRPRIP